MEVRKYELNQFLALIKRSLVEVRKFFVHQNIVQSHGDGAFFPKEYIIYS